MDIRIHAIVAIAMFFLCPIAFAEDWKSIDQNIAYDAESLVRNGDTVRAWLTDTSITSRDPFYSASLTSLEINCKDRTLLELAFYFVYKDGSRHKGTPKTPYATEPILPGSTVDKIAKALCVNWYEVWKR